MGNSSVIGSSEDKASSSYLIVNIVLSPSIVASWSEIIFPLYHCGIPAGFMHLWRTRLSTNNRVDSKNPPKYFLEFCIARFILCPSSYFAISIFLSLMVGAVKRKEYEVLLQTEAQSPEPWTPHRNLKESVWKVN